MNSLRGIGVEQPAQETDQPGCGTEEIEPTDEEMRRSTVALQRYYMLCKQAARDPDKIFLQLLVGVIAEALALYHAPFPSALASIGDPPTAGMLRALGWSVAVHNDYRIDGQPFTFWLWTHPSGRWVKGEGRTDAAALAECLHAVRAALASTGEQPDKEEDFGKGSV